MIVVLDEFAPPGSELYVFADVPIEGFLFVFSIFIFDLPFFGGTLDFFV